MLKPIRLIAVLLICAALLPTAGGPFPSASAAPLLATAPPLGTWYEYAVLGASTVTNTGASVITGDVGVSPETSITGLCTVTGCPGRVDGTIHTNDADATQAQVDVGVAYTQLAGQPCDTDLTGQDLGGQTLVPGVYCFNTSAQLTGVLTLDAQGDPAAVWVFKIGSTLTTAATTSPAPPSSVTMIGGGSACNVFWQVGSSATLGTNTVFIGNILALASIGLTTGATMEGAALARTGAVTMDTNNVSLCFGPNAIAMQEFEATSGVDVPLGLGAGAALLVALGLIVIRRRALATQSALPSARQEHGE